MHRTRVFVCVTAGESAVKTSEHALAGDECNVFRLYNGRLKLDISLTKTMRSFVVHILQDRTFQGR